MILIQGVRLGFQLTILLTALFFQMIQPQFISLEVLQPIYLLLMISFFINGNYLFFLEQSLRHWSITGVLFVAEALFVTLLVYYVQINQSLFLFLYLVNIILCGFVFGKRGAFFLAFITSIAFNFSLILGPELRGQTLVFTVVLNNLSFFAIAALSGVLSEQLDFMGVKLKEHARDLRDLQQLNRMIVDNLGTGLVTVDPSGTIVLANPSLYRILEKSRSLVGDSIDCLFPKISEKIKGALRHEERLEVRQFEEFFETDQGDKRILDITASFVNREDNEKDHTILLIQDLTQLRKMEFAVRQSEKLAAVGQLAAGIAHEIRNPLASISGSIQFLQANMSNLNSDEKRLMNIMIKEIDRLNKLISEFLEYVRPDKPPEEVVDLGPLLDEILDQLEVSGKTGAVKQKKILEMTSPIMGNRDKLKQVFLNMMINAYQALEQVEDGTVTVHLSEESDWVVVRIQDNGCGMSTETMKRVFEPFHTTKPKGTGLGLAISHKIVESHRGRIHIESELGKGASFILEFPKRM